MLKNHFFLFLIYVALLSGCKSILSPIEDDFKPSSSLDELSVPQTSLNTTNGNLLEDKFRQEVEALIKTKEEDLSSYYENYLDSLKLKPITNLNKAIRVKNTISKLGKEIIVTLDFNS